MSTSAKGAETPAKAADQGTLDALAKAVESGAGLPAVARAAARVLDASVALIERSGAVLAVAGGSPEHEGKMTARGGRGARGGDAGGHGTRGGGAHRAQDSPRPPEWR